jgi:hypothetical protein
MTKRKTIRETARERAGRLKHLRAAIRIATRTLRECATTKMCDRYQIWPFTLLAKAASSGHSVDVLLGSGATHDAKLIVRTMFEAAVDIHYLLHDPLRQDKLLELLELEIAVDRHAELKAYATGTGAKISDLVRSHPAPADIVARFEAAKKHPAFHGRKNSPERWSRISIREKLKDLKGGPGAVRMLVYTAVHLGNAVAHSRYVSLRDFVTQRGQQFRFNLRPSSQHVMSAGCVAFEATICIMLACDAIVSHYYLSDARTKEMERLIERMGKLPAIGEGTAPQRGKKRVKRKRNPQPPERKAPVAG